MASKGGKKKGAVDEKHSDQQKVTKPPPIRSEASKARESVHFHLPHTNATARDPKYPRRSSESLPKTSGSSVIKCPVTSEAAIKYVDEANTLTFVVDMRADKTKVKEAMR